MSPLHYNTSPVYSVRTVGALGNLSVSNGQTADYNETGIREAIDAPIVISGIKQKNAGEKYFPKITDRWIYFDKPANCRVFTVTGQEIVHRENITRFSLDELGKGIYIFLVGNKENRYSFKVVNR